MPTIPPGLDITQQWAEAGQRWRCPACERSKEDIRFYGKNGQIVAKIVTHHDHIIDLIKEIEDQKIDAICSFNKMDRREVWKLSDDLYSWVRSFDETDVCEHCNNVDVKAKSIVGAQHWVSFAPREIRNFIKPARHVMHEIDQNLLDVIWDSKFERLRRQECLVQKHFEWLETGMHWAKPSAGGYRRTAQLAVDNTRRRIKGQGNAA